MTDPRTNDRRLSLALRHAAIRGATDKHRLMLRASDAIVDIEQALCIIGAAIDYGEPGVAKFWLEAIAKTLGCEGFVTNGVDTDTNPHDTTRDTSSYDRQ